MTCPHCNKAVKLDWKYDNPIKIIDTQYAYFIIYDTCPNCDDSIIYYSLCEYEKALNYSYELKTNSKDEFIINHEVLIYPFRREFEYEDSIPKKYLEDYNEAKEVIGISPKASAALSRRLLQFLLRDEFHINEQSLSSEINKFVSLSGIPSHITSAVDAIRNIGNLAAHPEKEKNTGNIVNVEPGEAEWLIDVLESLFDFKFVQPLKLEIRKEELNEKLRSIGKPEMK